MATTVKITGLEEALRRLEEVTKSTEKKIVAPVLRTGSKTLLDAMKAKCPVRSGTLKKSLGRTAVKRGKRGAKVLYVVVGPRRKMSTTYKGKKTNPTNYAHLVEFGTAPHVVRVSKSVVKLSSKALRGKALTRNHPGAAAQPFIRPAYDSTKNSIRSQMEHDLVANTEKVASGKS